VTISSKQCLLDTYINKNITPSTLPLLLAQGNHLLRERTADPIVRGLRLKARIKQQRVLALPPAIRITHTPNRDTHALLLIQARIDRDLVVRGRRALDIELRHGALLDVGAEQLHGGGNIADGPGAAEMGLRAHAVDGDAGGDPLLNSGGEALGLCVGL
jgi:hypothetical protein